MNLKKLAFFTACLLAANLLGGCAALLERSYSVVEPYADRYWDSGAEDTLRAETYQDLVNSLLLLIDQHAEDGVIRCYGETGEYTQTLAAKREVRQETMLGSYLLRDLQITAESGPNYSTLTCQMLYREDAEEINSIMTISDSQSLVDLLRLTVREDRKKLTAHFPYDTPREDVIAAVESLWQELCRSEMEQNPPPPAAVDLLPAEDPPASEESPDASPPEAEAPAAPEPQAGLDGETDGEADAPQESVPTDAPLEGADGEAPEEQEPPPEEVIEYPPCPWTIRFYPDQEVSERIVEVLIKS